MLHGHTELATTSHCRKAAIQGCFATDANQAQSSGNSFGGSDAGSDSRPRRAAPRHNMALQRRS